MEYVERQLAAASNWASLSLTRSLFCYQCPLKIVAASLFVATKESNLERGESIFYLVAFYLGAFMDLAPVNAGRQYVRIIWTAVHLLLWVFFYHCLID